MIEPLDFGNSKILVFMYGAIDRQQLCVGLLGQVLQNLVRGFTVAVDDP